MAKSPLTHFFTRLYHKTRLGLFGRAFLLLFTVIVIALSSWLFAFFNSQEEPWAQQIANRAITALNIAQRSLSYVPVENHSALVIELATVGDTQLFPRESSDITEPLPNTNFWQLVEKGIQQGFPEQNLLIASKVNEEPGLWLSMQVKDEEYWLLVRHPPLISGFQDEWLYWSLIACLVSLIGSALITYFATLPINRISHVVRTLGRGGEPPILPTNRGPSELRTLFAEINRMVADTRQADSDRQIMLAGISHDLRTPLARMRLEIEMSEVSEQSREAIDGDIEQITHCIGQLLEYSRPIENAPVDRIDVSRVLQSLCEREQSYTQDLHGYFDYRIENELSAHISEINLQRIVGNLIENARRYGRDTKGEIHIHLRACSRNGRIHINIGDQGRGVEPEDIPRILKPFSRGETARSGVSGAGLGLAICERLLKQVGGRLELIPRQPNGLLCKIVLPLGND